MDAAETLQKVANLECVSGLSIESLTELFCEGYTLKAPQHTDLRTLEINERLKGRCNACTPTTTDTGRLKCWKCSGPLMKKNPKIRQYAEREKESETDIQAKRKGR